MFLTKRFHLLLLKHGNLLFLATLASGIYGLFCVATPLNAPLVWAWKYLSLPLAVIVFLIARSYRPFLQRELIRKQRKDRANLRVLYWPLVVGIWAILLFFSAGWANYANALLPSKEARHYEGNIIQKFTTVGKGGRACVIKIRDTKTSAEEKFSVSEAFYQKTNIGDPFKSDMTIGGLGIPFTKRQ